MDKLNELLEKKTYITRQMGELRDKMRDAFDAETKMRNSETYKQLRDETDKVNNEIKDLKLRQRIEILNSFGGEVNRIWPQVMSYKGDDMRGDGEWSTQFEEHLDSIETTLIVYPINRYGETMVVLADKQDNKTEREFNARYEPLTIYNPDEVIAAREQHNELINQLYELKAKIERNYKVATANYKIRNPDGDERKFF